MSNDETTDEVDRDEELKARFSKHSTPKHARDTQDSNDSKDAYDTEDSQGTDVTRDRKQYVMYLPPELHDRLNERYNRYDGLAKLSGDDGIEKHKEFLEAVVEAGLDHPELDDRVGVDSSTFE